jgi:hypothetical protein
VRQAGPYRSERPKIPRQQNELRPEGLGWQVRLEHLPATVRASVDDENCFYRAIQALMERSDSLQKVAQGFLVPIHRNDKREFVSGRRHRTAGLH